MQPIWKFVFVLILGGHSALAAEGAAIEKKISLEELVSEVLAKNPEVGFYQAELEAARGNLQTARTLGNPELSSDFGRKTVRDPVGIRDEGYAYSVSLMQPFEWPGRIALRKAIANRELELAGLGFEQFRRALASRARLLALTLVSAEEESKAASEVAERFSALREVLVARDPAGLTPLLETRIIEATELKAQNRAAEARDKAARALFELNQLRGEPFQEAVQVALPSLNFEEIPSPSSLVEASLTNNFEIRMRELELDAQGLRVSLSKNERFPNISVGPFYSEESAGEKERVFGVGLSVPLPLWNRNEGKIATEKARAVQAETILFTARRDLERRVREKAFAYETKRREIARWKRDSIQEFRSAAELADRHYRLGAVPVATYVELQTQYLEAVETLLKTQREALEVRQELQLLTGLEFETRKEK